MEEGRRRRERERGRKKRNGCKVFKGKSEERSYDEGPDIDER
jgi:hypothetical protein